MKNNEVTILIPTRFDSRFQIELCLQSIRKYTHHPYRIIIGDAGVDNETQQYLQSQKDIKILTCADQRRPKNELAAAVQTSLFMFLHDDAQILKKDWLRHRVDKLLQKENNGVLGVVVGNYKPWGFRWRKWLPLCPTNKRFYPLCLLVKKEVQDWG